MTGKLMQCCYTNAVNEAGGKISSGWQAVVASEDLPPEAYTTCVNLQRANSWLQSHMVDEKGNILNLFEINSDGAYVYVMRTQYGLIDRLGRPNMFSHAYIFSWKQEGVIDDPNVFLTLTEDWFAKDEETARKPKDKLKPAEPFTLDRALAQAGMTAETYRTLLQCVYAQYSEKKASKPLYVQYDGTEEQLRALLYCIYYGLPYCVRRNLSIASTAAGTTKNYNLIFSIDAARNDSFVVPQTGETSVMPPRIKRKIARCGFVEYAAQHYSEMDVNDYFRELEKSAVELGDPAASDELVLKIAHRLGEGLVPAQLQGAELDSFLSDALRSKSHGSPRMEEHISSMLDAVCSLRRSLTEENEANLAQWLARPVTAELGDAGERYNIYRLRSLPPEEGAKLLRGFTKPLFNRYSRTLLEDLKGQDILDCFYDAYGLEGGEVTWEALNALLDEVQNLPADKTRGRIDTEAWNLYQKQIEKPGQAQCAAGALMELMRRMYEEDQLDKCSARAKEIYWSGKTLQSFSSDRIDEYKSMRADTQWCNIFMGLFAVLEAYRYSDVGAFFQELSRFVSEYEHAFDPPWQPQPFLEKLEIELMAISPRVEVLSDWIKVAALPAAEKVIEDILILREQLYQGAFGKLVITYQKIVRDNDSYTGSSALVDALSKTVEKECQKADGPEHPVPVDVWLVLGRSFYPDNAFQIFDRGAACAACLKDTHAADQSELFSTCPFIQQAEKYAQGREKSAKMVRKWIQARKHRQSNERKAHKWETGSAPRWSIESLIPPSIFSQRLGRGSRSNHHGSDWHDRQGEDNSGLRQTSEESEEITPARMVYEENDPQGTASDKGLPEAATPEEDALKKAMPEEDALKKAMPEEEALKGATPEEDTLKGAMPEEDALKGATPEEDALKGAMPEEDALKGATPEEDALKGATPEEDTLKGATPEEGFPNKRETAQGKDIYI